MSLADLNLVWLRPWWLCALLPVAGWAVWCAWQRRRGRRPLSVDPMEAGSPWAAWVDAPLRRHVLCDAGFRPQGRSPGGAAWEGGLAALLVVALAGPAMPASEQPVQAVRPALTRVLLIDLSPAFAALPEADRERIRAKLRRALDRLPAAETALVVYAQEAYVVVPPSTDTATAAQFVADLDSSVMPLQGDRPAVALSHVADLLARGRAGPAEVLWVSPAAPVGLARLLAASPLVDRAPVLLWAITAQADGEGAIGPLKVVAGTHDETDLERLRGLASQNDPGAGEALQRAGWLDLGPYLILLTLVFLALGLAQGRQLMMVAGAVLVGSMVSPRPAVASDTRVATDGRWRGIALYRAGDFAGAAEAWEVYDDADALYNRGNALAHLGRLVDALALYEAALVMRPNDVDFRHNRDVIQRLLKPPPAQGRSAPPPPAAASEATRLAEQWARRVPDAPVGMLGRPTLLQRKLQQEHARRLASGGGGGP